jgi:hypothetical protein
MSTQPARGMRDFLPGDVRRRDYVVGIIRSVYDRYGFEPLETPAVENIETLLGRYGEENSKLIFKILMRGEHEASGQADLALRYDLTVPLARVVADYTVFLDPPTGFVFVKLPVGWKFVGRVDPKDVARAPGNVVTAMLVDAEESVATNSAAPSRDQSAER